MLLHKKIPNGVSSGLDIHVFYKTKGEIGIEGEAKDESESEIKDCIIVELSKL